MNAGLGLQAHVDSHLLVGWSAALKTQIVFNESQKLGLLGG